MNKEDLETYTLAAVGGLQGAFKYYVQQELTAERAWGVLGLSVLSYEAACPRGQLLSEGVDRAIEKHPIIVPAVIGYVALHLMNALPQQVDLLHQATRPRR